MLIALLLALQAKILGEEIRDDQTSADALQAEADDIDDAIEDRLQFLDELRRAYADRAAQAIEQYKDYTLEMMDSLAECQQQLWTLLDRVHQKKGNHLEIKICYNEIKLAVLARETAERGMRRLQARNARREKRAQRTAERTST